MAKNFIGEMTANRMLQHHFDQPHKGSKCSIFNSWKKILNHFILFHASAFLFTLSPYSVFSRRDCWLKLLCAISWCFNHGLPWVATSLQFQLSYPLDTMLNCTCLSSSKFFILRKQLYTHCYHLSTKHFVFSRTQW